jgi:hypothetical protein
VRRTRVNDSSDVRCTIIKTRRDLPLDCGEGFVDECLSVLRVTRGKLWKQDVDGIELGDDMTHDQAGAKTVREINRLPQSFVRCCAEVSANQDWSLELHSYSRMKTPAFRAPYRATEYADPITIGRGTSVSLVPGRMSGG